MENNIKDIIFISHATPDDNEFTVWLATKLELCGYKVWVDVKNLNPSDDFWDSIDEIIREKAIKCLFIVSSTSAFDNRDGVKKELAVADRVRKVSDPNFIIPIRIDNIDYNDFPVEIIRQAAVDFFNNWAKGLASLLEYLENENIPKANQSKQSEYYVNRWRGLKATQQNQILHTPEYYCSNVFPITRPDYLYAYHVSDALDYLRANHIPSKKVDDIVYSLHCPFCLKSQLELDETLEYESMKISEIDRDSNYTTVFSRDVANRNIWNYYTELINWQIAEFFYKKGLRKYRQDNRRTKNVYYFKAGIRSKRHEKSRPVYLSGRYRHTKNWHYGIRAYYVEFPIIGILISSHIVFTDEKGVELSDSSQIAARRSKGKTFYNKQWKNLLNSAIYYLADGNKYIDITSCCERNSILLHQKSLELISPVGFEEPITKVVQSDE